MTGQLFQHLPLDCHVGFLANRRLLIAECRVMINAIFLHHISERLVVKLHSFIDLKIGKLPFLNKDTSERFRQCLWNYPSTGRPTRTWKTCRRSSTYTCSHYLTLKSLLMNRNPSVQNQPVIGRLPLSLCWSPGIIFTRRFMQLFLLSCPFFNSPQDKVLGPVAYCTRPFAHNRLVLSYLLSSFFRSSHLFTFYTIHILYTARLHPHVLQAGTVSLFTLYQTYVSQKGVSRFMLQPLKTYAAPCKRVCAYI
jgi:hypothetical protein